MIFELDTAQVEQRIMRIMRLVAHVREIEVRIMLEQWVSELEPCIVYRAGCLIGLSIDVPIGVTAPIVIPVSDIYKQWEEELFYNDTTHAHVRPP